jgi:hypothetical protein
MGAVGFIRALSQISTEGVSVASLAWLRWLKKFAPPLKKDAIGVHRALPHGPMTRLATI